MHMYAKLNPVYPGNFAYNNIRVMAEQNYQGLL